MWALIVMLYLRGSEAVDELSREIDSRRASWAVGTLPRLLFLLARADATRDRWVRARSAYAESIELAHELGQVTEEAMSLAGLAWLEARTGAATCAENAAASLALATPRSNVIAEVWAGFALGEAALASGAADEALERFTRLDALLGRTAVRRRRRAPRARAGRVPGARRAVRRCAGGRRRLHPPGTGQGPSVGAGTGRPGARRCSSSRAASTSVFGEAARQHALTADLFETARTRLLHGQRLRRSRRRADAREPLRDALEAFERLGAVPWADRAAEELDATGATVVRRGASALDALSPRERQIVALVTEGLTTRETALRLFLSPKTVEYHLRNVYARLGITSRAGLVALVHGER